MKKVITVAFIILALFSPYVLANYKGEIIDEEVRVRRAPEYDAETIMYVGSDDTIEIIEMLGEFYKVKINNETEGYVYDVFVEVGEEIPDNVVTKPTEPDPNVPVNPGNVVNMMKTVKVETTVHILPLVSSSTTGTIGAGTMCRVLEKISGWVKVQYDNQTGWVRLSNLGD